MSTSIPHPDPQRLSADGSTATHSAKRGLILATRLAPSLKSGRLTALRTIVDRPVLQHVVEHLVRQNVVEMEIVLCDAPETVRALLDDGRRWGASIRYHLARDRRALGSPIRRAVRGTSDDVIVMSGDCLVPSRAERAAAPITAYCIASDAIGASGGEWSGLARAVPSFLEQMPAELDEDGVGKWLVERAREEGSLQEVGAHFRTRSATEWLAAQRAALDGRVCGLIFGGRERRCGVWLGSGARIHPTAHVFAPVWLGEDARVGPGATIGPGAVIGSGAIVEKGACVRDALVMPGTYLGEGLDLGGAVAEPGAITHAGLEAMLPIADSFLVGSVVPDHGPRSTVGFAERLLAAVLLLLTWPLALAGSLVRYVEDDPKPSVRDLLGRVLPGLLRVVRGEMAIVGVTPRDSRALAVVPEHWRDLVVGAPMGLITEAIVQLDSDAPSIAVVAADSLYAASRGTRRNFWLVGRYLSEAFDSSHTHARRRRTTRHGIAPLEGSRSDC